MLCSNVAFHLRVLSQIPYSDPSVCTIHPSSHSSFVLLAGLVSPDWAAGWEELGTPDIHREFLRVGNLRLRRSRYFGWKCFPIDGAKYLPWRLTSSLSSLTWMKAASLQGPSHCPQRIKQPEQVMAALKGAFAWLRLMHAVCRPGWQLNINFFLKKKKKKKSKPLDDNSFQTRCGVCLQRIERETDRVQVPSAEGSPGGAGAGKRGRAQSGRAGLKGKAATEQCQVLKAVGQAATFLLCIPPPSCLQVYDNTFQACAPGLISQREFCQIEEQPPILFCATVKAHLEFCPPSKKKRIILGFWNGTWFLSASHSHGIKCSPLRLGWLKSRVFTNVTVIWDFAVHMLLIPFI